MNKIKNRIFELREKINNWNEEYYINNAPSVDDAIFDAAMNELIELEKENPEFFDQDSPTQKVGGSVSSKFEKVKHNHKMLSLKNAFNFDDLDHFHKTITDITENISYTVEPKIDGLSISVIYENGILKQAISRGNGEVGENVTENVIEISSLPKEIDTKDYLDIRGEIYLSKNKFDQINNERNLKGEKLFANPRNAASGTIRQLDSSKVSERELDIFVYQALDQEGKNKWSSQSKTLTELAGLKFPTNKISKKVNSIEEVKKVITEIIAIRDDLDYEIDGVVVKVNETRNHATIGYTSKFPKWAIAYKLPTEVKETKLLDIFPTVGRTGRVTYNAKLEPVSLVGSNVQRATLHNADYIESLDLRIGDTVQVKKAGDIIPKVIGAIHDKDHSIRDRWMKPTTCPSCHDPLFTEEGVVDQYCRNEECPSRRIESIVHFIARDGMNIEGFSERQVIKFIELGFINSIADVYRIKKEDLIDLDGYQEKSINNLLNSINKSKDNPLNQLLFALGIRHIGKKTALDLAQEYGTIEAMMEASVEELEGKNDLGVVKAKSIYDYFKNPKNINLIKELKSHGLKMEFEKIQVDTTSDFYGKTVVVTGTVEGGSREDIKKKLSQLGAKVTSTVSSNTYKLLAGIKPSESKISKIEKSKIIYIKHIKDIDEI